MRENYELFEKIKKKTQNQPSNIMISIFIVSNNISGAIISR